MLFTLAIALLLNPFQLCEGSSTYQEEYRGKYVPRFIETGHGLQIVAPDTPYVAASGQNKLYFIDTRYDAESAQHIKDQIERATVPNPDKVISINEFDAKAVVKNVTTGETIFTFDPAYARVLFARGINRRNPDLKLPEHKPAGDWEVTYDLNVLSLSKRAYTCYDYGRYSNNDCKSQTNNNCQLCHYYAVDNECDVGPTNAPGGCVRPACRIAVDTPKEDEETDASYYQRMDKLHWH